jgi:hypothetical protein
MNIFDRFQGKIHEDFIDTTELRRQLRGFKAVDTPLSKLGMDTYQTNIETKKQQIDKQLVWTLADRNHVFDRIDSISHLHIAKTIKDIIISDGFNDVNNGNTLFIKYTDENDVEKSEMFTKDINNMIKRTNFLDILRDAIYCEGLDYGEIFLSKVVENGRGIIEVIDDIALREHIAIYSKSELLGAIRFSQKNKKKGTNGTFIPANDIAHFMLNYHRVPLEIRVGKDFDKLDVLIKEKVRVAEPILTPVVDLIKQYFQLESIATAIEIAQAIQPILLGVGVSPEQDISKISRQLQDWSTALNKNKNTVINNLDTLDVRTLLQSMNNIELIPYDVENNANAMKQIQVSYSGNNLTEKINDLRKTIALAVGVPEQYLSTATYLGQKDSKEDTIQTNPRYSAMLSRIQTLLAKGIREFVYSHLKAKYSNSEGVLKREINKEKIEVIFKSCTNLNDRLENENMMLRAETMGSLLSVIDNVAGSPNLPIKVNGDKFIKMWEEQLRNNPHVRDMFSSMNAEEVIVQREDNGLEGQPTGDSLPTMTVPVEPEAPAEEQDEAQSRRTKNSEQSKKQRKKDKAENDGDDPMRDILA